LKRSKYDWPGWFRRKRFRLTRGLHYTCSDPSMAQQVRNRAVEYGVGVRLAPDENGISVTVVRGEGPDAEGK